MTTKTVYKPRTWYKQLINIAKGQLQIEEVNYRAILQAKTKKNSLTEMSIPELFTVLEHMKALGFKPVAKKKNSPKSSDKAENTHTMLDKLRQTWIQMHYQGFLNDGSEPALQTWASNQSKSLNKGEAITKLEWLDGQMQYRLIEKLKQWHMRELGKVMRDTFTEVRALHMNQLLTEEQNGDFLKYQIRFSDAPNSHIVASSAYSFYLTVLKQHNIMAGK
jgi:phage gp16-like protein